MLRLLGFANAILNCLLPPMAVHVAARVPDFRGDAEPARQVHWAIGRDLWRLAASLAHRASNPLEFGVSRRVAGGDCALSQSMGFEPRPEWAKMTRMGPAGIHLQPAKLAPAAGNHRAHAGTCADPAGLAPNALATINYDLAPVDRT
jgi:hypothetical protein